MPEQEQDLTEQILKFSKLVEAGGDPTIERTVELFRSIRDKRRKLEKHEDRLKERICEELGDDDVDMLLENGLRIKIQCVEQTRIKESTAKEFLDDAGVLEEHQYSYDYPRIDIEEEF